MKTCIDLIINYDCPSSMMCAINCASDTQIDLSTTKIIPFNNYGAYYLRIRICENKVQSQQLSRYDLSIWRLQCVLCELISAIPL